VSKINSFSRHGYILNFKNPEGQLARWLEVLGTYNFNIKHRAGLKHGNADGLSRRPCGDCTHCDKRDENEIRLIKVVEIYSVSAEKIISDAFSYSENV
jgi:hypothetical protein